MVLGPKTTLILQRMTETVDSMGSYTDTWANVATFKGVMHAEWGNEMIEHKKKQVRVSHIFICDIPDVMPTEKDRFKDSSNQYYDILFADNVQGDHLEISLLRNTT